MYRLLTIVAFLFSSYWATAQLNTTLKSNLRFDQELSDIWGYVDQEGREYALVGLRSATAIVDITDPENPIVISEVAGPASVWRDIKTYGDHAFIITDRFRGQSGNGVHVLDLSNLPNPLDSTDQYFWNPIFPERDSAQLVDCHNLFIEEATGIAYLAGCNINNGGVIAVDVTNPDSLTVISTLDPRYSHDVYVRNDTVYSSDIFAGFFSMTDATDPSESTLLATQTTPSSFTHNTWLSDNGKVLFTTDERGNGAVAAYDISDLSEIRFLDAFRPTATLGRGLVPHNVHVLNDFLITSFYKEGVIITDASNPDNLIEVGNYDTFPVQGDFAGFSGCWGAYPFLPSGLVLASDIDNGLFVIEPTYQRAAYLEGMVIDAETGMPIPSASVEILSDDPNFDLSQASGIYKTGQASGGTFLVEYSKPGYNTLQVEVQLMNGEITTRNVELTKQRLIFTNETIVCGDSVLIQFSPNILDFPSYRWTFLEGSPFSSSMAEPVVSYTNSGTFTVRVEGLDGTGAVISSIEQSIEVNNAPIADFEVMTTDREVTFSNLSDGADQFMWTFGDGNTSEEAEPTHQYDSSGVFTVELTASNECGSVTTSQAIAITSTSLEEVGDLQAFSIAPNPFQSTAILTYRFEQLRGTGNLKIYDVLGKVFLEKPIQQKENQLQIGGNLPKGIYFVQLEVNNLRSKSIKLVKR